MVAQHTVRAINQRPIRYYFSCMGIERTRELHAGHAARKAFGVVYEFRVIPAAGNVLTKTTQRVHAIPYVLKHSGGSCLYNK